MDEQPLSEPPRDASRRAIRRRRLVALGGLLVLGAAAAIAVIVVHGRTRPAPPTTTAQPRTFRVIFPEGFTRAQMAERVGAVAAIAERETGKHVRLSAKTYLAASAKARVPCFGKEAQTNLEGFLFPSTYFFVAKTTSVQLVRAQIREFCDQWATVNLRYARAKNLTPYDVLSIASMVEREVRAPEERALVSAVIYNRLHARMSLGIDATLRYGLHIPATQSISASQLRNPSPYNTRLHTGLPPTPIANPGIAAIQAAAHPAHVDYLFYVRKPDLVHHFFTASASAFNQYLCAHGYAC